MSIVMCGKKLFMEQSFIILIILVDLVLVNRGVGFCDAIVIFFFIVFVLSMDWI